MDNETFVRYSFAGTLLFAVLSLLGLLIAGLVLGSREVIAMALASTAFAYLAQMTNTFAVAAYKPRLNAVATGLMLTAWAAFALGLLSL